jgi:hypothetical protein
MFTPSPIDLVTADNIEREIDEAVALTERNRATLPARGGSGFCGATPQASRTTQPMAGSPLQNQ